MKECASCKRVYSDDTLNFCLSDGSVLTIIPGPAEATLVLTKPTSSEVSMPVHKGVSPVFAYLSIGLLALIVGGALVAWYKAEPGAANKPPETSKTPQTVPSTQNTSPKPNVNIPPASGVDPKAENDVRAALDGWVQTLLDHDLEKHLSYYADRLERHRTKQNVDIAYVRKYNEGLFGRYSEFRLRLQNVKVLPAAEGQYVTTFESVYDFTGGKPHSGTDRRSEMRWKQINGTWKIVSES